MLKTACSQPNQHKSHNGRYQKLSKTSDWYLRITNVLLFANFTVAIFCNIVFFKISKMEVLLKNPKTMLAWTHLQPQHSAVFVLRASSTVAQLSSGINIIVTISHDYPFFFI